MKKRTPLSIYNIVPSLYYNKVIILHPDNRYELVTVGQYCNIPDPKNIVKEDYVILETDKYKCLINASSGERMNASVNKMIQTYLNTNKWYQAI